MFITSATLDVEDQTPALQTIHYNVEHHGKISVAIAFGRNDAIRALAVSDLAPSIGNCWIGASSCRRAANDSGVTSDTRLQVALFCIHDQQGHYATASSSLNGVARDIASRLVITAMEKANKPGQVPSLIWLLQAPGQEEEVLEGIRDVVGDSVPVFGGSSADNTVIGDWCQYDGVSLFNDGLVLCVMYPSVPISTYFSSGYGMTELQGRVTAVEDRRLLSIDNLPALEVYNRWATSEGFPPFEAGNVLASSTWCPFGRDAKQQHHVSTALLSHPAEIHADGSISLFSEVQVGETLSLMKGEPSLLIERAGAVVSIARQQLRTLHDVDAAGALVIYCGGCMLAVEDRIDSVNATITKAMGGKPYLVGFTFGEQGCFSDGVNRHGNLMISSVVFGERL